MIIGIIIVTFIAIVIIDLLIRVFIKKMRESRVRKEREEALDIGLKLVYKEEASSLKRVQVNNPKAKILAVDDEDIILDSFRKILTLAGYSVDTVTSGQEALGLIQKNEYDFVFTDLKMPEMDGLEVTKGVKHYRPDIDVIMITGFATIESAVDAMKYGALDYVQKPFTEDELVDFVNKSLIRRKDKKDREKKPKVYLLTPSVTQTTSIKEVFVPVGVFISPNHTWINIEMNGAVRVGIDDFAHKIIGHIDEVILPKRGQEIKKGDPLFSIKQDNRNLTLTSPISGKVIHINSDLADYSELIKKRPYEFGWICDFEASNLTSELQTLKIGIETKSWYQEEIDKYLNIISKMSSNNSESEEESESESEKEKKEETKVMSENNELWEKIEKTFFER